MGQSFKYRAKTFDLSPVAMKQASWVMMIVLDHAKVIVDNVDLDNESLDKWEVLLAEASREIVRASTNGAWVSPQISILESDGVPSNVNSKVRAAVYRMCCFSMEDLASA